MTLPMPAGVEQSMQTIADLAEKQGDSFVVKIMGRRGSAPLAMNVATFAGARMHHISNAESWIQRFLGGGEYMLSVFHATKEHERVGAPITISIPGAPLAEPDMTALTEAMWAGPSELRYPAPRPVQAQPPMTGTPRPVIAGYTSPTQVSATPPMTQPGSSFDFLAAQRDIEDRRARLAAQEMDAKLAAQKAEFEAKMQRDRNESEQRVARELEESRRRNDQAAANSKGFGEMIAGITAALAPIATAMIQASKDARIEAARIAAEAAAESRRAQEANMALIMKALEKPAMSPEITAMLELSKHQAAAQGDMMSRMVDAMGTVSKTSVSMIETIAELSAPPEGNPMLDAVKEGVKAMVSLTRGTEEGARKMIKTQAQLPAQTAQAAQAQQRRPAPAPAKAPPEIVVSPKQVTPVEVVQFDKNAPRPNMPPVSEKQPPFGGFEDEDLPAGVPEVSGMAYLEQLIRERYEPVDFVADKAIEILSSEEGQAALAEHDFDIEKLVGERLGAWLLERENYAYVERLVEKLGERGALADDENEPAPEENGAAT